MNNIHGTNENKRRIAPDLDTRTCTVAEWEAFYDRYIARQSDGRERRRQAGQGAG